MPIFLTMKVRRGLGLIIPDGSLCETVCVPIQPHSSSSAEVIDGISSKDLKQALEGNTVISTSRIGKYFWLDFSEPGSQSLLLHFGETRSHAATPAGLSAIAHWQ